MPTANVHVPTIRFVRRSVEHRRWPHPAAMSGQDKAMSGGDKDTWRFGYSARRTSSAAWPMLRSLANAVVRLK